MKRHPKHEFTKMTEVSCDCKRTQRLAMFALVLFCAVTINEQIKSNYIKAWFEQNRERIEVYRHSLAATLSRHDYLPRVLTKNRLLFEKAFNQSQQANELLESIKNTSKADYIYILNSDGNTIASSNWQDKNNFIGNNYGYRPYFSEAIEQGEGDYFGVGATTHIAGVFVSAGYPEQGEVQAVVVAKLNIDRIESNLTAGDNAVFISDKNDVIVLSNKTHWRYKTLKPLTASQRESINTQKQFGDAALEPLKIVFNEEEPLLVSIDQIQYLRAEASLGKFDWTIHYLTPYNKITEKLISFWLKALLFILMGLAVWLLIRARTARNALQLSQGESSELRRLNVSLEHEILERKQAQEELQHAELVLRRSSKLSAMGQLAASITHELGQPLSAMKTTVATLGAKADGMSETQTKSVTKLSAMIERMISITQQLRYFARSGDKQKRRINLCDTIEGALSITEDAIDKADIALTVVKPTEAVTVFAGSLRMEQVLVNLIRNAIDALLEIDQKQPRTLLIELTVSDTEVLLMVQDNGMGLTKATQQQLFEPFFTTKPSGVGMGLGLAISSNIINELDGTLSLDQHYTDGARFIIKLATMNDYEDSA